MFTPNFLSAGIALRTRKLISYSSFIGFASLLAACGGGGGSSEDLQQSPSCEALTEGCGFYQLTLNAEAIFNDVDITLSIYDADNAYVKAETLSLNLKGDYVFKQYFEKDWSYRLSGRTNGQTCEFDSTSAQFAEQSLSVTLTCEDSGDTPQPGPTPDADEYAIQFLIEGLELENNDELEVSVFDRTFTFDENGEVETSRKYEEGESYRISLTAPDYLDCDVSPRSGSVDADTLHTISCQSVDISFEDGRSHGMSLGAIYSKDATTFRLWSPDSSDVKVKVYGEDGAEDNEYKMTKAPAKSGESDVFEVTVQGDLHKRRYEFFVNRFGGYQYTRDPYGIMVKPRSTEFYVLDMAQTDYKPASRLADIPALTHREASVIYEVHVRDFTHHSSSGVDAQKRGKFLGMVEAGKSYKNVPTGLDHLVELGATHVQILPFYDFRSCEDEDARGEVCYNWGYDPLNYNVPEERYAVDSDPVARIREVKEMVDKFHAAGLRVVMDVVYNHTPGDWVFKNNADAFYLPNDLSGAGETLDGSHPMVSKFIEESLHYWVREYGIDGFRFDLVGTFDHKEVEKWSKSLNDAYPDRDLLIYGEPWMGSGHEFVDERVKLRLGNVGAIPDAHFGVFNDQLRNAMKGSSNDGGGNGFIFRDGSSFDISSPATQYQGEWNTTVGSTVWNIWAGTRGCIRFDIEETGILGNAWDPMFASDPEQCINYVTAHDNLALRDKILAWNVETNRNASEGYMARIQRFAHGMLMTSQGVPFVHAGAEMLRYKQGVHDSYKSSDEVNQIDWQLAVDNADVVDYYKTFIQLRKAHPILSLETAKEIEEAYSSTIYDPNLLTHLIDGTKINLKGDTWKKAFIIYNAGSNRRIDLPPGTWKVAAEASQDSLADQRSMSGSIEVEGTAVTVLYQD